MLRLTARPDAADLRMHYIPQVFVSRIPSLEVSIRELTRWTRQAGRGVSFPVSDGDPRSKSRNALRPACLVHWQDYRIPRCATKLPHAPRVSPMPWHAARLCESHSWGGASAIPRLFPAKLRQEYQAMPDQTHPGSNSPPLRGVLFNEQMYSLAQAARLLPAIRGGKPPHPATLYRWATAGRKSRSGRIVRLGMWLFGGTNCTSIEALCRFFDGLNDLPTDSQPPRPIGNVLDSTAQAEVATAILGQRGLVD